MRRSLHDLSFENSLSMELGQLIPVGAVDVLPGDTFRVASQVLARISPLAKPIYQDIRFHIHHFYVPNRIIWDGWEDFIVGNTGGATYPTITPANAGEAALYDTMGAEPVASVAYDALPIYAFNMIFNEYYRDQDLVTERAEDDLTIPRVAWSKDYFTTARAQPQQGSAVEVSFSAGEAPLANIGIAPTASFLAGAGAGSKSIDGTGGTFTSSHAINEASSIQLGDDGGNPYAYADLSQATGGIDINDIRDAMALQRIAEARNFMGSRYVDYLRWYGVNPSDGRLDRPEYVGGGAQRLSVSEVLATADSGTSDVGDYHGHGILGLRSRPARKFFEEHGWLISCAFIRPKAIYQTGIPRRFLRRSPEDWWHRELELLPWQALAEAEIFGAGSQDWDATPWAYTPRYDEYRETQSYVSGQFRGGTEEDFTLAREFAAQPTLNSTFVECDPSDRIYLDNSQPDMLVTIANQIAAKRLVAANPRIRNSASI